MKQLGRLTPAALFKVAKVGWGGRYVGLADYKIQAHNEIRITYTYDSGSPVYPKPLYISGADARTYDLVPVKSNPNIKLRIIPISALEVLERI